METNDQIKTSEMVSKAADKTICLCAIMKDEEKILTRLIDSCKDIIDYWVIIDTGSTDGSIKLVKDRMAELNIPGELHEREWISYGKNRNQLMELAMAKADYLLLMDCDMTTHPEPSFDKSALDVDSYQLRYTGEIDFAQNLLVSGRKKWHYVGSTHEFITTEGNFTNGDLRSLPITHHSDGFGRVKKLERDKELLEKDLLENPGNMRSYFYLGQTYANMGLHEQAIKYYAQRITVNDWPEEVYYSKYQIGLAYMQLGKREEAKKSFLAAWEFRPHRAEALYMIGFMCREEKLYQQSTIYLDKANTIPYPVSDLLFIHRPVWEYLIKFDLAISCFYTGRYQDANDLNEYLLTTSLSDVLKKQVIENQKFVLEKLGKSPDGKSIAKPFLVVSMFTKDTNYKEEADKLAITCREFKITHEIYEIEDRGSWEKNTQSKAVIIKEALLKHKKPIVWVDADAVFKKFPELFLTVQADIMYHFISEWKEILVGTLYFDYNPRIIDFLDKWIKLNDSNTLPDGVNFATIIIDDHELIKGILPGNYCKIFDNDLIDAPDPVIIHTQASRRNKGMKPAGETAQYESILDGISELHKDFDSYAIIGNGPFISDLAKEIDDSFVMRCNDYKIGDDYKNIGLVTHINISSLYFEIIPNEVVPEVIFGVLPISDTGYQKYTVSKEMHKYWEENAKKLGDMGNEVLIYDDKDRFYHEVFLPVAESIGAFPTVGILAIALARWWKAKRIVISGFTFFAEGKTHYNHEKDTRPGEHHNTFKEKLLLRSWIETDDNIEYILDGNTREALYDFKREKWSKVSQPFEINWHRTQEDWRADEKAWAGCKENLAKGNPKLIEVVDRDQDVLDIGCGPRTMLEFFPKCKRTLIEPLGEEYKKLHKFLNGDPMYSVPAEQFIPELENKFSFVWCHNVLDHCYDWKRVLENMFRYLKDKGMFYIATDAGFPPNDGHPGIESTQVFMKELSRYKIDFEQKNVYEPEDEIKRRSVEGSNHQIRSINLIGIYYAS